MVKRVTITMVDGEPTLVFWRIEDYLAGLMVSRDTGLPLTSPKEVEDEIFERFKNVLTDPDFEI